MKKDMKSSKNGFSISSLRSSADEKRKFVIQGYAMDGYLDDVRPRAAIFVGRKPFRALKCELKLVKLPPINIRRRDGNSISYMGLFYVDMEGVSKELVEKAGARLVVIGERKDKERLMIYKGALDKVYEKMLTYPFNVDESYVKNGTTVIKGWYGGNPAVTIRVQGIKQLNGGSGAGSLSAGVDGTERVGNTEADNALDYNIEFFYNEKMNLDVPECEKNAELGYIISVDGEYKKLKLTMSSYFKTGEKEIVTGRSDAQMASTGDFARYSEKVLRNIRNYGLRETANKIRVRVSLPYLALSQRYNRWISQVSPDEEKQQKQRERQEDFYQRPLLSVLVPLYETDERFLEALIDSVKQQTYPNWELCFSDGSRDPSRLKNIISKYSSEDPRIRYIADLKGPLGISANTNQAYSISKGEFIVLGDHDDLFSPDAFFQTVKAINEEENLDVIYTDEDKINSTGTRRFDPSIKPIFNQELLESCNYITHMFVVRRSIISAVGLFDERFDGAQDYDFILRCTEKARNIYHINKVVYSWRLNDTSTAGNPAAKMYAYDAGAVALQEHYDRMGIHAQAEIGDHLGYYHTKYKLGGDEQLYVVVVNSDKDNLYQSTVDSINSKSKFRNLQFIRINSEGDPILARQLNRGIDEVETLVNAEENASINDIYVMFIEAGVTMMGEDGIYEMISYISRRRNIAAVGAKIYCANGTISHSGVILGVEYHPGHEFMAYGQNVDLYFNASAYSALRRGAFIISLSQIRKSGEFSTRYRGEYSIIEYTYRLSRDGKKIIYNANASFYLGTSKGTNADEVFEKLHHKEEDKKLFDDRYYIEKKWDMYYPR